MTTAWHGDVFCVLCDEPLAAVPPIVDKIGYKYYVCPVCGCKNYTNEVEYINEVLAQYNSEATS